MLRMSSWGHFAGQNDVQPALHIPMVYENIDTDPQHWEYRVVSVDAREEKLPAEAVLDELGAQGWMLVSVLEQSRAESSSFVHYYFVRQKSEA